MKYVSKNGKRIERVRRVLVNASIEKVFEPFMSTTTSIRESEVYFPTTIY